MSRITIKDVYDELRSLKESLREKEDVFLLPPPLVCQTVKWLSENVSVQACVDLLSHFYNTPKMIVVDNEGDKQRKALGPAGNGIACYYPSENAAYFTEAGFNFHTICHEFFHHLVAAGKIRIRSKYEQKTADRFADEVERRSKEA